MVASRRQLMERVAGLGALAIAGAVVVYVLFITIVGAFWTEVPESPPGGMPADPIVVLRPAPIEPALIALVTTGLVIVGVAVRLRGPRWGLYVASVGATAMTIFGAIFIFGSFGLTFIAGVALLVFIAAFAWFGRTRRSLTVT